MKLIEIILFCLIIFCICNKYRILKESHQCLDDKTTSNIQNRANQIFKEANLNNQIQVRQKNIKKERDSIENTIEQIFNNTQTQLNDWITDSNNIFSWDNINEKSNTIMISRPPNSDNSGKLEISNIQVWGTGIINGNPIYKNWAKFSKPSGDDDGIGADVTTSLLDMTSIAEDKKSNIRILTDDGIVKCPQDYFMSSCTCVSSNGKCNGSEFSVNNMIHTCTAYPYISDVEEDKSYDETTTAEKNSVKAQAVCVRLINKTPETSQSVNPSTGVNGIVSTTCNQSSKLIDCNCIPDKNVLNRQVCKGTDMIGNQCNAYKNKSGGAYNKDTITAQAVCTKNSLKDTDIRHTTKFDPTLSPDKNESKQQFQNSEYKSKIKCKHDEDIIGCNAYISNPNPDGNIYNDITDIMINTEDKSCTVTSDKLDVNSSVFADATCAKFGVSKQQCVNDLIDDSKCVILTDNGNSRPFIKLKLSQDVNIHKIIIYNVNIKKKGENTNSISLYPIEIKLSDSNNNLIVTNTKLTNDVPMNLQKTKVDIPVGVKYDDYLAIKEKGDDDYFKGWAKWDNDDYYCRFINKDSIETTDGKTMECTNLTNPNRSKTINSTSNIHSNIPNSMNKGYLKNERNHEDGSTDYCRCVGDDKDNKLKCLEIKKNGSNLAFQDEFIPNKSLKHPNKCSDNTLTDLNNDYKIDPNTCNINLPDINTNSVDASFYNYKNNKYYIFKNIRIDYEQFVLFCEVDVDTNTIDHSKYPRMMSKEYWGDLDPIFFKYINTAFVGRNNDVYFISGDNICRVNLETSSNFTVVQPSGKSLSDTKIDQTIQIDTHINVRINPDNVIRNEHATQFISNISYAYTVKNNKNTVINVISGNNKKEFEISDSQELKFSDIDFKNTRTPYFLDDIKDVNTERTRVKIDSVLSFPLHSTLVKNNTLYIFSGQYIYNYSIAVANRTTQDKLKPVLITDFFDIGANNLWDLPSYMIKASPSPNN